MTELEHHDETLLNEPHQAHGPPKKSSTLSKLFRSKPMHKIQIIIQNEAGHHSVQELANLGCVEFVEKVFFHIPLTHSRYVKSVRACSELERKTTFMRSQIRELNAENASLESVETDGINADLLIAPPSSIQTLKEYHPSVPLDGPTDDSSQPGSSSDQAVSLTATDSHSDLDGTPLQNFTASSGSRLNKMSLAELEQLFARHEEELLRNDKSYKQLLKQYYHSRELSYVLSKGREFFSGQDEYNTHIPMSTKDSSAGANSARQPLLSGAQDSGGFDVENANGATVGLQSITGTIERSRIASFERIVWLATRGNVFIRMSSIDAQGEPLPGIKILDPNTSQLIEKTVFVLFFQGERLNSKLLKICDAFGCSIFNIPKNPAEKTTLLQTEQKRADQLNSVLTATVAERAKAIARVASQIKSWESLVSREKTIYHTLNLFQVTGAKYLTGEAWCPVDATRRVADALAHASERAGALVRPALNIKEEPHAIRPTFFETNKFTAVFFLLIDSYGINTYQEISPAPMAIIMFPFLFAVMFGDLGHGFLLTLIALFFVMKEKKHDAAIDTLNEGIAGLHTGRYALLLMGLFSMYTGTIYNEIFSLSADFFGTKWAYDDGTRTAHMKTTGDAYPFGVDPVWDLTVNKLNFLNPLKMKLSLLMGVSCMVYGLFCSLQNFTYFKKTIDILHGFIPQMVFLMSVIGYLCFLIVYKWTIDFSVAPGNKIDPPQLLNTIIAMFLSPTEMRSDPMFAGQHVLQLFLLFFAFISVPWLFLIKPNVIKRKIKKAESLGQALIDPHTGHPYDMGEVWIHQGIHAIEFVLGCISNSASYLRLWALSLAHSELSFVFWTMAYELPIVATRGILVGQAIAIYCSWSVWAALTIAVLLGLESMSAVLHAVRLGKF